MILKGELDIHITSELFWADSYVLTLTIILGDLKFLLLIVCNLSEFSQMFNNGNMYYNMIILLMMYHVDLTLTIWVKYKHGLMHQLSFGLQKKQLCDNQLIKQVNRDDPELKNRFRLSVGKTDDTVTSKPKMISSSWIRMRNIMAMVLLVANI